MNVTLKEGNYEKLGAVADKKSVIFTFEAEKEAKCAILLFDIRENKKRERIEIPNDYCIGSLRSVKLENIEWKYFAYQYEIDNEILIDPYAKKIKGREVWNKIESGERKREIFAVIESPQFDWKQDKHVKITKDHMIMYKLHVRGFSRDGRARGEEKGTFSAVMHRIPYLKELGITTVEFMPIYEFEEMEQPQITTCPDYLNWTEKKEDQIKKEESNQNTSLNYWGYTKSNYFAVKTSYGKKNPEREWMQLVEKLHENQMEVVMEMYFEEHERHSLILEALRYWVREYHVDGFHLLGNNLPITAIVQDPLLSDTKIFYTGFELSLLEKGKTGSRLFVYNDEYLYPVRKIINRLGGNLQEFTGQQRKQDESQGFVNYFSSNNGFTLADVFAYERKHNESNGEENRDGNDWNFSANCGAEGATRKKQIRELREQQMRNAFACLLLAQGVPMIWSGDEIANSQQGNNNAYCQDNEIGWVNWKNDRKERWLSEYLKKLILFRKNHTIISNAMPMKMCDYGQKGMPDLSYHEKNAWMLDFVPEQQDVGMMYCGGYSKEHDLLQKEDIYLAYNFHVGNSNLALPQLLRKKKWYLVMDTSLGREAFLEKEEELSNQQVYQIKGQSVAILVGRETKKNDTVNEGKSKR